MSPTQPKNSLEKIYFINPQKIASKTTLKEIAKNKENSDLSSDDYEKLAKILQVI